MAKGPRELMKRKIDQSVGHVDYIQLHIQEMGEIYAEHHPDIVEQLKVMFAFFEQGKELLEIFRQTY